ncbi:hypothetical protein SKAU_G00358410 [Synaphobranchus kaupii]|uniref:Uncharacterized protein n=1 Tax=Synaphobranchus kaupii TaxID=118154 RepID=A0A9Q1EHV9_SYNKA|nr:hypothetical protein SKAU_G00358410 [Synaphobranchus kaupii]
MERCAASVRFEGLLAGTLACGGAHAGRGGTCDRDVAGPQTSEGSADPRLCHPLWPGQRGITTGSLVLNAWGQRSQSVRS